LPTLGSIATVGGSGPAVIVPYDPRWPLIAERLLRDLRSALDRDEWLFDHIGSTSVPGLAAKNLVDLQIRAFPLPSQPFLDERLGALGYRSHWGSRPDSPGVTQDADRGSERVPAEILAKHLYWRDPTADEPGVVLHIRRLDSPFGRYSIWFRNWLRVHDAERDRYAAIKRALAAAHADDNDFDDYTRAKTAYLDEVQEAFESWARQSRA
jgi:dephospho-CoA kinase